MKRVSLATNSDLIWIFFLGAAVLATAVYLSRQEPFMIVLVPTAFIFASLFLNNARLCLATAILVLPLLASGPLSIYLLPVAGAKINNILLLLLLIGFLLNWKLNFSGARLAIYFYIGSIALLVIATIRTEHVAGYAMAFWFESYQPFKFFLSHGMIPLMTSIPFLMIAGGVRTREDINQILYYIALSMTLFALVIVSIYFFQVPSGSDFSTVRQIIGIEHLGMHGNNLADFFIVGFPLIFAMALLPSTRYRKWFCIAALLLFIAATLIYSRSAYLTILLSIPAVLLLTRKIRLIFPLLVLLLIIIIITPGVIERATTGLEEGEADVITAGRTDEIWRPVIREWFARSSAEPIKVLFGYGRYGIMDFQAFRNQRMIQTTHPHNMYLDTLINTGAVGLIFYLTVIGYVVVMLSRAFFRRKNLEQEFDTHITAGLLVAIICFLIRGITDSFLMLHLTNSYFYIIMALSFVVLWQERIAQQTEGGS